MPPVPPDQGEAGIIAARDVVESAVEALLAAGFKADRRTMRGHPSATIVETLERGDYDLALLGAGTKRWLDRLLLGSTSMGVLHGSSSSVLVVREALPDGPPTRIVAGVDGSPIHLCVWSPPGPHRA